MKDGNCGNVDFALGGADGYLAKRLRPLPTFGLRSMFSNVSEKPQERKASSATRAVLVLRRRWVENVSDERHTLPIPDPMTSSEVVWGVRAEVHLTKIAENDSSIENQKLRVLVPPLRKMAQFGGIGTAIPTRRNIADLQRAVADWTVAFAHVALYQTTGYGIGNENGNTGV